MFRDDVVGIVGRWVQAVEREERGCGVEHGTAEEVFEIALEGTDRNLADPLKIILEPHLGGLRAPGLEADVIDGDSVVSTRQVFGVWQGEAAGVFGEIRTAD